VGTTQSDTGVSPQVHRNQKDSATKRFSANWEPPIKTYAIGPEPAAPYSFS
jgi:hypothetical protein